MTLYPPPPRKLIEVAIPLEAINRESVRSVSNRSGHPWRLHTWWARRPLAACRAVIFCSLVDDPESPGAPAALLERIDALEEPSWLPADWESLGVADQRRRKLFKFIETLVQWESTTDEEVIETARELILAATDGNPPPLLDPFCGSGSIPLEAQRLGLEAHGSDLNPVAVLITKALIELPPKFAGMPPVNPDARAALGTDAEWKGAAGLAADVRWYGEWMRERAWERIGHLYPEGPNGETVIAWLWARTVKCPNPACGAEMPLIRSLRLAKRRGSEIAIHPIVEGRSIRFEVHESGGPSAEGTASADGAKCLACDTTTPLEYVREYGQTEGLGRQLLAVVEEGANRRDFRAPNSRDATIAHVAVPHDVPAESLPRQALGFRVQNYGYDRWSDLFMPRQITALSTFSALVDGARELAREHAEVAGHTTDPAAYAAAVATYLSFAVGRSADRWSSFAVWQNGSGGSARGAFARQALPMVWDFVEANPFSNATGSWTGTLNWVAGGVTLPPNHVLDGQVRQGDAGASVVSPTCAMVVTDPPYYDNVPYADVSDFFYVWLRRSLRATYPDLCSTLLTPKNEELVATPHRFEGRKDDAEQHFERGLFEAFRHVRSNASTELPTTLFYAYKQATSHRDSMERVSVGWETMLSGVISSGFTITGTWPVRTEKSNRTRAMRSNALSTSVVIVCRPRPADAPVADLQEFNRALALELPVALQRFIGEHIAPVDLPQASIGPGMAVFSRYSAVLAPNGERMSVRRALELINEGVEQFFSEREGSFDTGTQFCLRWFEQFGFEDGAFGDADSIARAKDISVEELSRAGALTAQRGRVRLIPYERYETGWQGWAPSPERPPTEWQACHYLAAALEHGGIRGAQGGTRGAGGGEHDAGGAARVARDLGGATAARAIELAYRLYAICDAKGWPAEARRYNALADSWQEISAAAHDLRQAEQPRLA